MPYLKKIQKLFESRDTPLNTVQETLLYEIVFSHEFFTQS